MKKLWLSTVSLSILFIAHAASVKVSSFKPDRKNATAAVQKALDSGAAQIIFDDPGFEYLITPVKVSSNSELIFENGCVIRALPGAYKGKKDYMFAVENAENVTFRGVGTAVITMNKRDYQNPALYLPSEWRHAIAILSCKNVTIKDLTVKSSGGDGIYVGKSRTGKMAYCENITLENLILDDHHRQGVSVISAKNLLISNCNIKNTSGTPPACGIDFEPNGTAGEVLEKCVVENCRFSGNKSAGILVYIHALGEPADILIRNCTFLRNGSGIKLAPDNIEKNVIKGAIRVEKCTLTDNINPLELIGQRGTVTISFTDCVIDNRKGTARRAISLQSKNTFPFAGVDFGNLSVRQPEKCTPITFESFRGAGMGKVTGSITVYDEKNNAKNVDLVKFSTAHPGNPELFNFQTSQLDTRKLLPLTPGAITRRGISIFARGRNIEFVQHCDGKTPVHITFQVIWRTPGRPEMDMPLEMIDEAGNSHGIVAKLKGSKPVYTFRSNSPMTATFRLKDTFGKSVAIYSDTKGFAYNAAIKNPFFRCRGKLYFQVPAGVKNIAVEVSGEPNEPVEAVLVDARGIVVARVPYSANRQLLKYTRNNADKTELYRVEIIKAYEDWNVRLQAPLPPLFYLNPADVMEK